MTGFIKDRTKGGMVVDLLGLDAFLPGSQLDIKPVQDYDAYVGKHIELKVVKLNPVYRNIVVSHKAIIEEGIEEQRHKILSKLEKGQALSKTLLHLVYLLTLEALTDLFILLMFHGEELIIPTKYSKSDRPSMWWFWIMMKRKTEFLWA